MGGGLRPGVISCSPDRQRLLQCRLTSLGFLHQRFGICDCAFEIWRHLVFGIWNFKAAQVSSAASWFVRTGSICFIWSHLIQIFQCSYLKEVSTGWFYIHIFATEDMAGGTEVSFVELILIFRVIFSDTYLLSQRSIQVQQISVFFTSSSLSVNLADANSFGYFKLVFYFGPLICSKYPVGKTWIFIIIIGIPIPVKF